MITGLTDGIVLMEPDQRIVWANDAALAMHGTQDIAGLGSDVDGYRERFRLRFRNNHPLPAGRYPIDRALPKTNLA